MRTNASNQDEGAGGPTEWRPLAYVCVADRATRTAIVRALEQLEWSVVEQPTGFHVVEALAGVIAGDTPWLRPGLIVIDAIARGCAGTTVAHGLRELGLGVTVVLVTREAAPFTDDVITVDPRIAEPVVAELARRRAPRLGALRTLARPRAVA